MSLIIADFDQTMTKEGIDFWYESTLDSIQGEMAKEQFLTHMKTFKANVLNDPKEESKKMFNIGLSLLGSLNKIRSYFLNKITSENLREDFYDFIIRFLKESPDNHLLISSANYHVGLEIVREKFFSNFLKQVHVSGTLVNEVSMKVQHINVAENKITGIQLTLNEDIESVIPKIKFCFGDDPIINDKYILDLKPEQSYLFTTQKNKSLSVPYNRIGDLNEII